MDNNIASQPANLGEVNLTLRFMQRGQDAQAALLKEVSGKIDSITQNFTPLPEFAALRTHIDKDLATKEEVAVTQKTVASNASDIKVLNSFKDSINAKIVAYSSVAGGFGGALGLIINHFWK